MFKASFEIKAVNDKPIRIDTTPLSIRLNQAQSDNEEAVSLDLSGLEYLPGPTTATDEKTDLTSHCL